jgi:hypothetical protein
MRVPGPDRCNVLSRQELLWSCFASKAWEDTGFWTPRSFFNRVERRVVFEASAMLAEQLQETFRAKNERD